MKRWHEEESLMQKRWAKVLKEDKAFRNNYPRTEYRNRMTESGGGPGWMRKRRPNQGCGCPSCQWEKYEKGQGKRKMRDWQYEQLAEGEA